MLGDEVTTEEMAENQVDTDTGEGNSENIRVITPLKERENGCVLVFGDLVAKYTQSAETLALQVTYIVILNHE